MTRKLVIQPASSLEKAMSDWVRKESTDYWADEEKLRVGEINRGRRALLDFAKAGLSGRKGMLVTWCRSLKAPHSWPSLQK